MKMPCLLTLFLLILYPVLDISWDISVNAQNWTYENGSYWLDDLIVNSKNKTCDVCGVIYDPDDGHTCKTRCEFCGGEFEDIYHHYQMNVACANAAGYSGSGNFCCICGRQLADGEYCDCAGPIIPGHGGGDSNGSGGLSAGGGAINGSHPNNENNSCMDIEKENDSISVAGVRYWKNKDNCIPVRYLNFMMEVTRLKYLPDSFIPQGNFPDCVARAFATSIYLHYKGNLDQYRNAYTYAYSIALMNGIDLTVDGIDPRKFHEVLGDAFLVQTHTPGEYTRNIIFNYIDTNYPVVASIETDYIIPLLQKGVHALTIVAYDPEFYYCAYGGEDVVKIPHGEIEKYPIYIVTDYK